MRHPPYGFEIYLVNVNIGKRQNHKEDGANFCGLLRKAELYHEGFVAFETFEVIGTVEALVSLCLVIRSFF